MNQHERGISRRRRIYFIDAENYISKFFPNDEPAAVPAEAGVQTFTSQTRTDEISLPIGPLTRLVDTWNGLCWHRAVGASLAG